MLQFLIMLRTNGNLTLLLLVGLCSLHLPISFQHKVHFSSQQHRSTGQVSPCSIQSLSHRSRTCELGLTPGPDFSVIDYIGLHAEREVRGALKRKGEEWGRCGIEI